MEEPGQGEWAHCKYNRLLGWLSNLLPKLWVAVAGPPIPSGGSKEKWCPLRSPGPTDFFPRGGTGGSRVGPLCPFLPKRRAGLPGHTWGCLPRNQDMDGAVFLTQGLGANGPMEPAAPPFERRSWHLCPGGSPQLLTLQGLYSRHSFSGTPQSGRSISVWAPDPPGLLDKPGLPPTPLPSTLPSPAQGSLNISLPEVAIVGQFVGLAGGALRHFVRDA